jgi:nucleoside-diphosphate-sugar epimerase
MSKPVALVTGASGEMGHAVVPRLVERGLEVVAVDLVSPEAAVRDLCLESVEASILDAGVMQDLIERHRPVEVFHLAAVLSRKAEADPDLAHRVNVEGTWALLGRCTDSARAHGRDVTFLFPSSIAVYGLPGAEIKNRIPPVKESEWVTPRAMYGCNKLYCELLGTYFTERASKNGEPGIDFRSIRFPGLISSDTLPTGGTSDYASEMIHAAAQSRPYACFVREDARLPFMTMPDAVDAMLRLAEADAADLSTRVYNIRAFSPSAGEIRDAVLEHFPQASIGFEPDPARQAIVDSWPGDVDDGLARSDWGLAPRHGLRAAMGEYLMPALCRRYGVETPGG